MATNRWLHHRTALAVLGFALAGDAALAMNVEKSARVLARSADGATLKEVREHGPEGGGALTYRVEGTRPGDATDFLVSSNFSPGDGSQPQRVLARDCEQRLTALGAEIARRRIPGVAVHPERCRTASRDGLVTVAAPDR